MKFLSQHSIICRGLLIGMMGGSLYTSAYAAAAADISVPDKRRGTVELGGRLAKAKSVAPLPENLALPFSPPGFELPDAQEHVGNATAGKTPVQKTASDRDVLEEIIAKVPPSGTVFINGEARLMFRQKTLRVGDHLSVPLNGRDYDLELVTIDRTTFTLRLNREEITRPIKPAKSP